MNAPTDMNALSTRVITVNLPAQQEIEGTAFALLESAQLLLVDSPTMHEIAADELRTVKTAAAKLEETRKLHVSPLNEEVKYINDWFRQARSLLEQAEADLKQKMLTWQEEQERKRRAEQLKLEQEARMERARLASLAQIRERAAQQAAERMRAEQEAAQARERAAQAEAARRQAEIEAAQKAGDEARAAEAARLAQEAIDTAAREHAAAEAAKQEQTEIITAAQAETAASAVATMVITAPVVPSPAKVAGIATKGTWKGKCTDLLALVQFVAKNPQYVNLLKANDTAINALAKAQREATKVDGLLVWEEKTLAARRA